MARRVLPGIDWIIRGLCAICRAPDDWRRLAAGCADIGRQRRRVRLQDGGKDDLVAIQHRAISALAEAAAGTETASQ